MLVVTANWAFSDGTLVAVKRRARAARAWLRTVRRGVVCGSFGRDGAYRPPRAVDVVLAGDTFDGSFLARLLAGDDLATAAAYANVAAALSTQGYGAVTPIPRADAVRAELARAGRAG